MISIDQLKAAFDKSEPREGGSNRPNNYYPFWNMKDDEQAIIRFLPDKNGTNPLGFMVEKSTHTLIINGEKKNVPCRRMFGEDCPVCKVSSSFYKEEGKTSANGKKYWRKKGHLAQALIIEDPLAADAETGENHQGKIRYIALGYQLFNVIKEALTSGDLDAVPFSYAEGYNFVIKKSKQGEYSTYSIGSRFKNKPTALSDEDVEAIESELVDLTTLLPKDLGEEKLTAMLEADLTGAEYKAEESESAATASEDTVAPVTASVVKAKPAVSSVVKKATPVATPVSEESEEEDAPVVSKPVASAVADTDDAGDDEADAILKQIHARRLAKAAGK